MCRRRYDICRELHVISQGCIKKIFVAEGAAGAKCTRKGSGYCIGVLSFLFDIRETEESKVCQTSPCTCFILKQEDYRQLIKLYPNDEHVIHQNALGSITHFRANNKKREYIEGCGLSIDTVVSDSLGKYLHVHGSALRSYFKTQNTMGYECLE